MRIRKLEQRDAVYMLEWMHDDSIVHDLAKDFSKKTIDDCIDFIAYANDQYEDVQGCTDLHMAVTGDNDEYMGTVSLKSIDRGKKSAEFAITIRAVACGKGYGKYAMDAILNMGFKDQNLECIYWCVDKNNLRARRFYEKQGYKTAEGEGESDLMWYSISRPQEDK